jgi:glutaredoxin 3|tara:strand:- start:1462 stop:1701 length:240 start_codon:yes stop_codon:yes gene_type:complete
MKVEIYSKENCPSCNKTKSILKDHNPIILMLDKDFNRDVFFEKFPEAKSFPQVMINDNHVGGYEEVNKWLAFNMPNQEF